jgi:hypothetical protein
VQLEHVVQLPVVKVHVGPARVVASAITATTRQEYLVCGCSGPGRAMFSSPRSVASSRMCSAPPRPNSTKCPVALLDHPLPASNPWQEQMDVA